MQLTDEELARVETAVAKLPKMFAPLEGDAVPLGPGLLLSSGYDLEGNKPTAVLFNDAGEILYLFNHVELANLKQTGRIPTSVPIPTAFDERGRLLLADWVHELS